VNGNGRLGMQLLNNTYMIYIVCSCKFVFKLSSPNTWANIMAKSNLKNLFTMQNQIKMNRWTYCLWHNMNITIFNALSNIINDFLSKSWCTYSKCEQVVNFAIEDLKTWLAQTCKLKLFVMLKEHRSKMFINTTNHNYIQSWETSLVSTTY